LFLSITQIIIFTFPYLKVTQGIDDVIYVEKLFSGDLEKEGRLRNPTLFLSTLDVIFYTIEGYLLRW
ncbi:hypothetical protein ACJX0J_032073, partial [Zea mays]